MSQREVCRLHSHRSLMKWLCRGTSVLFWKQQFKRGKGMKRSFPSKRGRMRNALQMERSTPVPVGPIPTRMTMKPVHTNSSPCLFTSTSPHHHPLSPPTPPCLHTLPSGEARRRLISPPNNLSSLRLSALITRQDQWGISRLIKVIVSVCLEALFLLSLSTWTTSG